MKGGKVATCSISALSENIIRLKELTRKIDFETVVRQNVPHETVELEMEKGTSYMVGLFKNEDIAIARNYASAGCIFPEHSHEENEVLIVYQGEMIITVGGVEKTVKEKEFIYVKPNTEHRAEFSKETWFAAITFPASKSWPEGG